MRGWCALAVAAAVGLAACTNDPYPEPDAGRKVRYRYLLNPVKTLDPAVSYTYNAHQVTANIYETLLEYHYLRRPYELIPGLAEKIPEPRVLADGRVAYRFRLREGLFYQDDPAFARGGEGRHTREVVAGDVGFELMRIADPALASPISSTLAKIDGLLAFTQRLEELREGEPGFAELRIDRQYARAGGISGVRVRGRYDLEVVLSEPYPQLLYWFAMPFTAPVPWEAVAYYDGAEGRDFFKDHPVGAGPFHVVHFERNRLIALERNENWYGIRHPEWRAPGAVYPSQGESGDAALGRLDPAYTGRPLPFVDRVEFRVERENIPRFNKFLQGYYDESSIIQESYDQLIHEGDLSAGMRGQGMGLDKAVDPDVFYIGFNMKDPVVGTPAGERGRKLRQAMSLAVDALEFLRVFSNGRGVPAQSPLPPGIFGYDADYANPYRQTDIERAKALLREAGYPNGLDPATGRPLHLNLDSGDTTTRGRLRYRFFANAWSRLGLDVEIQATTYNQFQDKVAKGAHQIFLWGWIADYPDPENFFFLLWGPMAVAASAGPNSANFDDPSFNELFVAMKDLANGPERLDHIRQMRAILERERPWIELYHRESYTLFQPWLRNVKTPGLSLSIDKYRDVDIEERTRLRDEWNRPIVWPAYALAALAAGLGAPAVVTLLRERQ